MVAMRHGVVVATLLVATSCRSDEAPALERDCAALIAAAVRGERCDPALRRLADTLTADPDERACRTAVRGLLGQRPPTAPAIRSIHDPPAPDDVTPLSDEERDALRDLPHPATLVVVPDVPPEPGLPSTRATLDGIALTPDAQGPLRATILPGPRTLEVRRAGNHGIYCVDLRPCEPVTLTAHGTKIARHPDVTAGPCT